MSIFYTNEDIKAMVLLLDISIMDALMQQNIQGFDSLLQTSRFVGARDIVDGNDNVFNDGTHGTSTLSCLAANAPGKMVGTSPNASFYLLANRRKQWPETLQEEYNWAYGAEVADSIGAEVFSTSLGYTTFDNNRQSYVFGFKWEQNANYNCF
jgi:serine protease AprX